MDQRVVGEHALTLLKILSDQKPSCLRLFTILETLLVRVRPTLDLLVNTQICEIVSIIKRHKAVDAAVIRLATKVTSKWRAEVKLQTVHIMNDLCHRLQSLEISGRSAALPLQHVDGSSQTLREAQAKMSHAIGETTALISSAELNELPKATSLTSNSSDETTTKAGLHVLSLPTEILAMILYRVSLSKPTYRAMVLTCHKFRNTLKRKSFRLYHAGKHLTPDLAMHESMGRYYRPQKWIGHYLESQITMNTEVVLLKQTSPYQDLPLVSNWKPDFCKQVRDTMESLFSTSVAVLKHIQALANDLGVVSHESLNFVMQTIARMPNIVVVLLRWLFYTVWLKIRREGVAASLTPSGEEFTHSYCRIPSANPQHPLPAPATLAQTFVASLPSAETRTLFMLECAFLFGPATGMLARLLDPSIGSFSGPFFWFMRDSSSQPLFRSPGGRQLFGGSYIMFNNLGVALNNRVNKLSTWNFGLVEPPVPCPASWESYIEKQLAASAPELWRVIQMVKFPHTGRMIKDLAMANTKKAAGVKRPLPSDEMHILHYQHETGAQKRQRASKKAGLPGEYVDFDVSHARKPSRQRTHLQPDWAPEDSSAGEPDAQGKVKRQATDAGFQIVPREVSKREGRAENRMSRHILAMPYRKRVLSSHAMGKTGLIGSKE